MNRSLNFHHPSLEEVSDKEWLVTNGIGGYASSSICGMNTRRYHGLLVASLNPPTQRQILVSRIEETVVTAEGNYALATNQYPGAIHPTGYQHLSSFSRHPFPEMTFRFEGLELRKTVFMPHGSNSTVVEYYNPSDRPIDILLRPHFVDRDYHSLFTQLDGYDYYMDKREDHLRFYSHYGATPLFISFTEGTFHEDRNWHVNLEYKQDFQRGQDFSEHSFTPGFIKHTLDAQSRIFLLFTIDEEMLQAAPAFLFQEELKRLESTLSESYSHPFIRDLIVTADQFLVHRRSSQSKTIIAGYHWFTDWGRDTMIAMLGLTIALGKKEVSKSILQTFLSYADQGMVPNRFPDQGEAPEYNTVDATLWIFVAAYQYVQKFNDWEFIRTIFPQLAEIIEFHIHGTRYHIHVNQHGFLFAGGKDTQLTWMDARVWGFTVTPRWGCPIEVNALWYNALCSIEFFAQQLGASNGPSSVLKETFERNFKQYFLNEQGYLHDVIVPDEWADDSFRPNQLYALSLPFPLLNKAEGRKMLKQVKEKLLTPYGLRSLSMDHPDFKPVYSGNQWDRDTSYHQGTVWPFLLGAYYQSVFYLEGNNAAVRKQVEEELAPLLHHFYNEGCIHGIAEIFDGAEPKEGKGTVNQAWSVSSLIFLILQYQLFNTTIQHDQSLEKSLA